jgi:membrane fusion protein, multidrug efflux system
MKKILITLVVLIVLGAAGAGIWYRVKGSSSTGDTGSNASANDGDAPAVSADSAFSTDLPIPVEGAQVVKQDLILEVRASGQAAAWQGTGIKAQVAGTVKSVPVRENSSVNAGDVLVLLDSSEVQLTYDDAVANLARAQATYREQTIGDDRIEASLREERAAAARIRSGVDQAEIAVKKAALDLRRTHITAPFGGRVAFMKVVPGQRVNAGEEVLQVVDINPIKVEVQVLESEVGYLRAGGGADITFAAFPGEPFKGTIETINPVVDQATRQARVTVRVPNPQGRLLPGMYANVTLDARHLPDRTLVPREAILERDVDRRTMLFVFNGDGTEGTAEWRYVTVGLGNSKYVEIVDNPETKMVYPGEIVLVGHHNTLVHGARVKLTENAAADGGRPR